MYLVFLLPARVCWSAGEVCCITWFWPDEATGPITMAAHTLDVNNEPNTTAVGLRPAVSLAACNEPMEDLSSQRDD